MKTAQANAVIDAANAGASVHHRALLVSLSIKSWAARKFDKQATADVLAAHGASSDAGRFNKTLLPGSEFDVPAVALTDAQKKKVNAGAAVINKSNSHKRLLQHVQTMRQFVYKNTLAWDDEGKRLLPIANYHDFMDGINKGQHEFDRLLREFVRDYPHLKAKAKVLLNGMFREEDYPEDVETKFSYTFKPYPVPQTGDFRVSLAASEVAALEAITAANVKAGVEGAMADATQRLYDCVKKIHERLSGTRTVKRKRKTGDAPVIDPATGEQKVSETGEPVFEPVYVEWEESAGDIFRDTLIDNARSLCDVLAKLNVTGDARLESFRRQTELLAMTEAETIRQNDDVRAEVDARAKNLLDEMDAAFGDLLI